MRPVCIGIGHNDNFIVVNVFHIEFIAYTAANRINNCINLFVLKISASFAFSVLITLPRNGNTAWNRRSRPCFAEPPAESPLLGIVHFSAGYVIVQVLTYHLMYLLISFSFTSTRFLSRFTSSFTCLRCFNCFSHKKCGYVRVFF